MRFLLKMTNRKVTLFKNVSNCSISMTGLQEQCYTEQCNLELSLFTCRWYTYGLYQLSICYRAYTNISMSVLVHIQWEVKNKKEFTLNSQEQSNW